MATCNSPDPLGSDVHVADTHGKSWRDVGCQGGHTAGPIRVADADAPTDKSKKPAKATPAPNKVDTIIWHIYVATLMKPTPGGVPKGYYPEDFKAWFNASDETNPDGSRNLDGSGKWAAENIQLEWNTNPRTGVQDFEKSLKRKGAIVVYIGHSALTLTADGQPPGPSRGLTPQGKDQPEIPNATLSGLLSKSAASLVILGSCDSKTAVGRISDGPPIIATNSGSDRKTDISRMTRGAGTFLFLLAGWELDSGAQPNNRHKSGRGTIDEALAASAEAFTDIPDRFELVHGDGSMKLFP
jgi:hypothetical protein